MTKKMYDCAFLPDPAPVGFDVAAGYVYGQGAANVWSVADWDRAKGNSRYLLPIATCWPPFGNPRTDAKDAANFAWQNAGIHAPCAFALDVEVGIAQQAHDSGYIGGWRQSMRDLGYYDVVYSSLSAAHLLGDGPCWIAVTSLGGSVVITQDRFLGSIDTDTAADIVPFFDTQPTPIPTPGVDEMDRVIITPQSGATAIETEPGKFVKVAHQPTVDAFRNAGWHAVGPVSNDDYERIVGQAP